MTPDITSQRATGHRVALLVGQVAGLAAPVAGPVLVGAVATEAFVLTNGSPVFPAVVLTLLAVVAWQHHASTFALLQRSFRSLAQRLPSRTPS